MRHTWMVGLLVCLGSLVGVTLAFGSSISTIQMLIGEKIVGGTTQNILYVDSAGKLAQLSLGTGQVPTLIAGALVAGTINAADPQLDNLSSVAINTALLPGTAGTIDLGSAAKPFEFLWLSGTSGTPGTNNFKLTGAATAARTITLPDASLTVAGIDVSNSWSAGVKQTFAPNATNSGLNIGSVSGDPASPANGDMWYDSTGNKFRCRENGSSANCIGSGSSVTLRDQLQNTTGTTYDWVPYDGCNGTTCTSSIYFNDEFCGNNPSTSAVSNGNLSWSAWDGVGTGSSAKGASTFPNVCFISLTSGATAGNFTGISLNDVATNGYGGLGDLHGNLNWELHWIFKFSSATTPAYYLGVASNPQSALIPTDWMGLQFDTSNSDTTNMTFVCKKGATVVRTDTTIAADTTFHHLRMWSTATNAINFELYDATGAIQKQSLAVCGSTSIPTSSMIPFAQAGTQAAAARTLSIDRFSYKMRGVSR